MVPASPQNRGKLWQLATAGSAAEGQTSQPHQSVWRSGLYWPSHRSSQEARDIEHWGLARADADVAGLRRSSKTRPIRVGSPIWLVDLRAKTRVDFDQSAVHLHRLPNFCTRPAPSHIEPATCDEHEGRVGRRQTETKWKRRLG